MAVYNIEVFLNDFSERTKKNFEAIEQRAHRDNLYEVTQLINSLLGMLILPYETYNIRYRKKYPSKEWARHLKKAAPKSFDRLKNLIDRLKTEKRLFCDYNSDNPSGQSKIWVDEFIHHLRNAVAHGGNNGIHFFPIKESDCRDITDVIFYDNDEIKNNDSISEFCVKVSVSELKEIVNCISDLYCGFEEKNKEDCNKNAEYDNIIHVLNKLMVEGRTNKNKATLDIKEDQYDCTE